MSNFAIQAVSCLSQVALQPNATILGQIQECQAAALTPFCYPPNGTRICMPSTDIPLYWPADYYQKPLMIQDDYAHLMNGLEMDVATGSGTLDFTNSFSDTHVDGPPGQDHSLDETKATINFRGNSLVDNDSDSLTIILVRTPRHDVSRRSTRLLPRYGRSYGKKVKWNAGTIAGVAVSISFAVFILFWWCCRKLGCCCCSAPKLQEKQQRPGYVYEDPEIGWATAPKPEGLDAVLNRNEAELPANETRAAQLGDDGGVVRQSAPSGDGSVAPATNIARPEEARLAHPRDSFEKATVDPPPSYRP